eukprot:Skav201388  [mRNA]  locus=scaffold3514:381699:387957:+ [translate_table: standard]
MWEAPSQDVLMLRARSIEPRISVGDTLNSCVTLVIRRDQHGQEDVQKSDEEIRVTAAGSVSAYVSRAATVFNELKKPYVIVQATGNALTKAVTAAEVIKRRFKGLHQITELKTVEITDEYEPLEEGLDKVTDVRNVSVVEIKLSKDSDAFAALQQLDVLLQEPLDTSDKGYQPPLDESMVKEFDPEDVGILSKVFMIMIMTPTLDS